MNYLIPILFAILLLFSCKKEKPKPFSYWKINGLDYSSNDVEHVEDKAGFYFRSAGSNWFHFSSRSAGNWSHGFSIGRHTLTTDTSSNDPELLHAAFSVGSVIYRPMPNHEDTLDISSVNNRMLYLLHPSWFVNQININDSVLIEGTFHQP